MKRWIRFNLAGAAGVLVQLGVLAFLVRVADIHYLLATALSVEAAVLHNFVWHKYWTWADRPQTGLRTLLRFNLTSGLLSIGGNVVSMWVLSGFLGWDPLLSNLVTIICCSLANFMLSERFVFRQSS